MPHRRTRSILVVVIVGLLAGHGWAQRRSTAIPVRLTGTVVAAGTGEPLAGADVRIIESGARTFTAPDGHFEFNDLPPGGHTVIASRSGYVTSAAGMSGPKDLPRPIELTAGSPSHVEIRLIALGAITGRIVDETGLPARGVQVRAIRRRATPSPRDRDAAAVSIDEDGRFAIRGLDPGRYFVIADKRGPRRTASPLSSTRREGDPGASLTYFPGTAVPDQAVLLDVDAGVETDATFTITPVRLARITGTVLDARGEPARDFTVRATTTRAPQLPEPSSIGFAIDSERFELTGLPPGEYVIEAVGLRADPLAPPYIAPSSALRASGARGRTTVQISGDDITGVTLRLNAAFKVSGRIVDISGNPIAVTGLPVSATPTDDRSQQILAITGVDGTFLLDGLLGRYLLRLAPPTGRAFALDRVEAGGVDATDEGLLVEHDTFVDLVVRPATQLRGVVRTREGRPMPKAWVVIFAESPAARSLPNSRFVRYEQTSSSGEFQTVGLPAGRYFASVPGGLLADDSGGGTPFVDDFATLLTDATPFSLANGETKSLIVMVD